MLSAKLAHGHVQWLINNGIHTIFYPSIPYERNEFAEANNHYNCPIVTSYPENIKNNIDAIVHGEVDFLHPFISFASEDTISYRLVDELSGKFHIPADEIKKSNAYCLGRTRRLQKRYAEKKAKRRSGS